MESIMNVKIITLDKRPNHNNRRLRRTQKVKMKSWGSLITKIVDNTPEDEEILHITLTNPSEGDTA
jgi:hypothetical protein